MLKQPDKEDARDNRCQITPFDADAAAQIFGKTEYKCRASCNQHIIQDGRDQIKCLRGSDQQP